MSDGFPIGAIIAFPGNSDPPSPDYWALCDGSSRLVSGPYAPLFAVIGFANGGSAPDGKFHVPDYRGRFLRGTSYNSGHDPNAATRTAMNGGGNTGNAVGSIQGHDAAAPIGAHFSLELPHLPKDSQVSAATAVGSKISHWYSGATTMPILGGDDETRPKNAYVLYYIKYRDSIT
jgi:microcystin-dependent protein